MLIDHLLKNLLVNAELSEGLLAHFTSGGGLKRLELLEIDAAELVDSDLTSLDLREHATWYKSFARIVDEGRNVKEDKG